MIENLNKITIKLNPFFITGFSDAEGCFHISVTHSVEYKFNWKVRATFQIGVHIQELPLLLSIQNYFGGVGYMVEDQKKAEVRYVVTKLEDLANVIIRRAPLY